MSAQSSSMWKYVPHVRVPEMEALALIEEEVRRQDDLHPEDFPPTRGGVRLALAAVQDELDETLEAWQGERRAPEWIKTEEELVQTLAVGIRLLRAIRYFRGRRLDQADIGQGEMSL